MDLFGLCDIPGWLLVVVMVVTAVYLYVSWDPGYWKSQNVRVARSNDSLFSGAWKIFSKPLFQLDQEDYKANGKVWGTYEGKHPVLMVADLELIKVLTMKNFQHFTDRRPLTDCGRSRIIRQILTNLKGDRWKEARAILSPIFTSGKLKQMSNLVEECCGEMIKEFNESITNSKSTDFELTETTSAFALDVIATCCFGCKIKSRTADDPFPSHARRLFRKKQALHVILQRYFPRTFQFLGISILDEKSLAFFHRTVNQVVGMRKQEKIRRNDYLQLLLDAQSEESKGKLTNAETSIGASEDRDQYKIDSKDHDDDLSGSIPRDRKVLTEDAIVSQSVLFYLDGFETVSNTINFALHLLSEHPHCQEELIVEVDKCFEENGNLKFESVTKLRYLDMVVSETLRLFPVITRLERVATEDSKFGGIVIREGVVMTVPIYSIHHDQQYFPDPEKFVPERFSQENTASRNPFTYLPFGVGPRSCIGIRFSLMAVKLFLAHLLKEFRVLPGDKREKPLLLKKAVHQLIPENGVHLKVLPRNPSRLMPPE